MKNNEDECKTNPEIVNLIQSQKYFFQSHKTRDIEFRIQQLKILKNVITKYEDRIISACKMDLKRPDAEILGGPILMIQQEINLFIKKLKKWAKPHKVKTPLWLFKAQSYIQHEPYGSVLIIGSWNAPLIVTLLPLVGVLAAGNCAIIKPSEISLQTSHLIAEMINTYFPPDYCTVIEGGVEKATLLVNQPFDFIVYTGNTHIGKMVYQAAAKNLIPVLLEMGGKCPCIIDETAHIKTSCRRISWAKFMNAGQICTAPDYLYIHKSIKNKFIDEMINAIERFYSDNPQKSSDYCRIINKKHYDRLISLLHKSSIIYGGKSDAADLYISPTLIDNVTADDPLMKEEIFGPILPILEYEDISEIIFHINKRENPLALYIYSQNKKNINKILACTSSGSCGVNASIMQFLNQHLPFGGRGYSGIGAYHGKTSFETFSHRKSVLNRSVLIDPDILYPPYNKNTITLMKSLY